MLADLQLQNGRAVACGQLINTNMLLFFGMVNMHVMCGTWFTECSL